MKPITLKQAYTLTFNRYWLGSKSERTVEINAQDVLNILGASLELSEISEVSIDLLIGTLKAKGNTPATINRKLALLSKVLSYALDRGAIPRKPKIEKLKEFQGRLRWVSPEEEISLLQFFKNTNIQMYVFAIMALDTGLRVSELLHLEMRDIENGWVRVWESKGGTPRSVPLTERAKEAVRSLQVSSGKLFDGLNQDHVTYQWNQMKQALGLGGDKEFVPHCLRHTFCSRLVQKGVSIFTIKELAGHSSVNVTMRYAHLAQNNLLEAIKTLETV